MRPGMELLESTDWTALHHAYGPATDTPAHLRALIGEDAIAIEGAIRHLGSAIIHQGTPWTATGPTVLVVAAWLAEGRFDHDPATRARVVSFLVAVAQAARDASDHADELLPMAATAADAGPPPDPDDPDGGRDLYGDDEIGDAQYALGYLGCLEVAPELFRAFREALDDPDAPVRIRAAMGAALLCRTPALAGEAEDLERRLTVLALSAHDPDERSAFVRALGDLGIPTSAFLDDPAPGVRLCAAMAPALASDPAATAELIGALERHAGEIDGWFADRPPQFETLVRSEAVRRLVERVDDFDRIADAAVAVVGVTHLGDVDTEWGHLLLAAFPEGGDGAIRSDGRRRFLRALVDRADLWDPRFGNASLWFRLTGLPYDRRACAERLDGQ